MKVATLAQGGAFIIFVEEYGGDFTCAVLTDGNVQCWGNNLSGQLGDGSGGEEDPLAPCASALPNDITAIAVGGTHSCAFSGAAGFIVGAAMMLVNWVMGHC